jgi:hypothetical protein
VKSVNYKLSTSTYLKLGETNVFIIFFLPFAHSLLLPPTFPFPPNSLFHSTSLSSGSARTRVRGRIRVRAYITPVCILLFCSFSPLPLVGVVGFTWQRPFRLGKGERVTSILRGIPLRFLQSKNSKGCIYLSVY